MISNSISGYVHGGTEGKVLKRLEHPRSQLHLHIPHSRKLGTTQVAVNKRMEKQNVVYAYNRKYSASRRKEILTCAIKWRNLEETILSEISKSQKDKDCMIPPMKRCLE